MCRNMNFFVTLQRPRQQIILTMRRYLRSARGSYLLKDVSQLQHSHWYQKIQHIIEDCTFSIYIYKLYLIILFVYINEWFFLLLQFVIKSKDDVIKYADSSKILQNSKFWPSIPAKLDGKFSKLNGKFS